MLKFLTRSTLFIALIFATAFGYPQNKPAQDPVLPSESHVQWADAEIGAIFHLDMPVFVPDYDWRHWGTQPPASVFNPTKLNTDQWIRAAKAAGAKYAVLVAKHCSGFSLWPTKAHEYSVKNCPWENGKGDIVADFIASCKKYGLKPGIYASASANGFLYVDNPGKVQPGGPVNQQEYNAIVRKQLTELWSNYGKLFEIWFDGGVLPAKDGGPDIAPLLKKLQPDAVVFQGPADAKNLIRWIGNENGLAPYPNWATTNRAIDANGTLKPDDMSGSPNGKLWCPGETDFPLRSGWQGGWFWKSEGQGLLTPDQLLNNYITSVGRNSNMLIGIVIDSSGLVPEKDVQLLQTFGDEIKNRFSSPVAVTHGKGSLIELNISKDPQPVNSIIIAEDISKGERIRNYLVEAWLNDQWQTVAQGESVGHKRIQTFNRIDTRKLRLKISNSEGTPQVKEFAVFNTRE
ncbi:MAG: alpha-L-fucosidase [Bacteroidota bacterium]|nr:alpha-L-fucosidase [Bacteroidota bacterium]MDP4249228.1 alpha-L-fucosidase [Bacteroidota bacterium]